MKYFRSRSMGLSPRGRGSHTGLNQLRQTYGSIPAWAGEPSDRRHLSAVPGVYPRVGGGASVAKNCPPSSWGLSPRGRGSHASAGLQTVRVGSIPAWAGEPMAGPWLHGCSKVYPRVGGGAIDVFPCADPDQGLSPRGRGSRVETGGLEVGAGSIPAWAGEPACQPRPAPATGVYPRVGGGADYNFVTMAAAAGLSPRGRGSRADHGPGQFHEGSIPAWAGEPVRFFLTLAFNGVYPRVGGGALSTPNLHTVDVGLSPRGRGSPMRTR